MKGAAYLVYSVWVSGGLKVFAVCSSRKAAVMARSRVAKGKKRNHSGPAGTTTYYDRPLSDPYACELHIQKVRVDVLYPHGLCELKLDDFEGVMEKTEVIK